MEQGQGQLSTFSAGRRTFGFRQGGWGHFDLWESAPSLAIIPVMLVHLGIYSRVPSVFAHGGMGVDLFFVLSGYLISGILLDAKGKRGYYRNFFARRGLRIWPLYYLVIVAAILISRGAPPFGFHVGSWLPLLTYTSNLTESWPPWPVAVVWSLCIEEQFYLAWPLLVAVCSRNTQSSSMGCS